MLAVLTALARRLQVVGGGIYVTLGRYSRRTGNRDHDFGGHWTTANYSGVQPSLLPASTASSWAHGWGQSLLGSTRRAASFFYDFRKTGGLAVSSRNNAEVPVSKTGIVTRETVDNFLQAGPNW